MIRIAERIWTYWREVEARFDEPVVVLLFASGLSQEEAIDAVAQAGARVAAERQAKAGEAGPGEDEFRTGSWSLAPVPEGVAVRIDEEPDDFEGLLRGIAEELDALGIEGEFDLYRPPKVVELPERADLLECRLRSKGERYRMPNGRYRWRADPEALGEAVEAGIEWSLGNGRQLPLSLAVGLVSPAILSADDDLRSYLLEGLDLTRDLGVVRLASAAPDRFRIFAVEVRSGRASFVEGGETLASGGWERSVGRLRAILEAARGWAVYGFVKRGSNRVSAELATSLAQDWVTVTHANPSLPGGEAFENEWAPDAFGVQLLGPGYAGRVPQAADWSHFFADFESVVLAHNAPQAWFGSSFAPFGGHLIPPTDPAAIPEVVARAREDLAEILFSDDLARS